MTAPPTRSTPLDDLVNRLWVQNESGQVLEASEITLSDEPVTQPRAVIAEWQAATFGEARRVVPGQQPGRTDGGA